MLISVMYPNGNYDLVKDFVLSRLIDEHGIVKFKRSSGWVDLTATDIRGTAGKTIYKGQERRQTEQATAELIDIF